LCVFWAAARSELPSLVQGRAPAVERFLDIKIRLLQMACRTWRMLVGIAHKAFIKVRNTVFEGKIDVIAKDVNP